MARFNLKASSWRTLSLAALALPFALQGCGRTPSSTSTIAGAGGSGSGTAADADPDAEYEIISDDDVEAELSDSAYDDVSDYARVKIFARGKQGVCSDWTIRAYVSNDSGSLAYAYIRPKVLEKRVDKDGVFGAERQGEAEVAMSKEHRGDRYEEMILRVRTHGARDGMVVLAPQGAKLSLTASYTPCPVKNADGTTAAASEDDVVTFPDSLLDVKNGKQKIGVTEGKLPLARDAALIVKAKLPKEPKAKKSKAKGKGKGTATAE